MIKPITLLATAMALLWASLGFGQTPTFSITPATVNAVAGDVQTYDVKVNNFTNLIVAQFAVKWKANILGYEAASISNLASLSGLTNGVSISDASSANGLIKVAWSDPDAGGETLPSGTTLFKFKLKALANGKDTVRFANLTSQIKIEIVTAAGNDIASTTTFQSSIVTVAGGVTPMPPPPPAVTGFAILAGNATPAPNATFMLDFKTQDFTNIVLCQYAMLWDPTKIQFVSVDTLSIKLPDCTVGGNFGAFQSTQGKLSFLWNDPNVQGVSKPNGTVIYRVRFKNLMPAGEHTLVNFGANPPNLAAPEVENVAGTLPFKSAYGIVSSTVVSAVQSDLLFYLDTVTVNQGQKACVSMKVKNFNKVVSFQYTHEWDKTKLPFAELNFPATNPLPQLLTFTGNAATQGLITFSYEDPTAAGVDLAAGTKLYEVCYNTTAASLGSNAVKIDSTPTVLLEFLQKIGGVNKEVIPVRKHGMVTTNMVVVNPVAEPFQLGSQQTNTKCTGGNDGSIDLIVSPATNTGGAYTYSWSGPAFTAAVQDISNLKAGVYSVTVTCLAETKTRSVTITEPAAITLSNTSITQVSCYGGNDGAISIATSGGTTPFTYKWSGPNSFTSTAKNISNRVAGSYFLTITDANNCTFQSSSVSIPQPTAALSLPTANISQTNVACFGGSDGSISISGAAGGTTPYSYAWGPTPFTAASQNIGSLKAGSYILTITDSKGCSIVNSAINISEPTALAVATNAAATADVKCFGGNDGKAGVSASGGTSPYSFSWFGGGQTTMNVVNLVAGTYPCVVTDAKGCSKTQSVTIGQPASGMEIVNVQVENVKCSGQSNGKITVSISAGGTAPYVYAFSGGTASGNMATGLAAGNYTFTVTDASGCSDSDARMVTAPAALVLQTSHTNQIGLQLGSVSLTVNGGTSPFSYIWSNLSTTKDLPSVAKGTYTVTVTDANGCSATATETVADDSKLSIACAAGAKPCWGSASGQVVVTMTDGSAPYKINWTDGSNIPNQVLGVSQNPYTITGLFGGAINVTVTDAVGSTATGLAFLTPNAPFSTELFTKSPTLGGGFTDGRIQFTVVGGTALTGNPHYTFSWTLNGAALAAGITNSLDTSTVKGLDEGKYCVTATDAVGCTVSKCTDLVRQYPPLAIAPLLQTPPNCQDSLQGALNVAVSGGDQTYTFKWTGPSGFVATTEDLTKLKEGIYTLVATDSRGETVTQSFTLTALSHLTATISSGSTCGQYDICNAEICDGAGAVSFQNAFGNPTFLWSNGEISQTATSLCDGFSTVTVSDAAGCKLTLSLNLSAPASIVSTKTINRQVTCYGDCDGSAQVSAIGGILPHTFHWSNGETGQVATKLCAGSNMVTITDAEGISKIDTIRLDKPDSLKVTLEATQLPTDFETCDAIMTAVVMGGPAGVAPIYAWNVPGNFDAVAENLCSGDQIFVSVIVGECKAQAEGKVPTPADGCAIGVPIITPGIEDGKNDFFVITCSELLDNNHLEVYNRWGQLVFQADDYKSTWDGTYLGGGKKLAEGVYFWVFTYDGTDGLTQQKGYVTLLRGDDE